MDEGERSGNTLKTMAELSAEEFVREKSAVRRERRLKGIAIGKLTIYAGDPGLGKSQGSLDLAARLSLALPFPDNTPCQLGDSLILTNEDDPGDTIRPWLDALEADVSRIHFLKSRISRDKDVIPFPQENRYGL